MLRPQQALALQNSVHRIAQAEDRRSLDECDKVKAEASRLGMLPVQGYSLRERLLKHKSSSTPVLNLDFCQLPTCRRHQNV